MMFHSEQRIHLVDYTKFGKTAFSLFANLSQVDVIVTDLTPENDCLTDFEQRGIKSVVN